MADSAPHEGHQADDTIQKPAELHQDHHRRASMIQRLANQATRVLGRPGAVAFVLFFMIVWMGANYIASRLGFGAFEQFPFPDLEFVASITALLVTLLILTTQRHADQLADKRAQLTLQIAILSEQKSAKIIELLEEQRRDNPLLASRSDQQASEMARSSDPREAFDQLPTPGL